MKLYEQYSENGNRSGSSYKGSVGCPMRRRRACSALRDDESASLLTNRDFDSASHRDRAPGGEVGYILPR